MDRITILRRIINQAVFATDPKESQMIFDRVRKFGDENKDLQENEFYKKFESEFQDVLLFNETEKLDTLKRIERNTGTIKNIIIFYLVISVLAAVVFLLSQG